MKNLQGWSERTHALSGPWPLRTVEHWPEDPKRLTLLLHGYNERGVRIFRKLKRFLPEDSAVIAPNGPFPLPRVKPDRLDFGYAWYFYDRFTQSYHTDQSLCVALLTQLLRKVNPAQLPVTVVGFSQGGYLAPLLGFEDSNIQQIIGIGCEFKARFFQKKPAFSLTAIHGLEDPLVPITHAEAEIDDLKSREIQVDWHPLPNLKHEITNEVGVLLNHILETHGKARL